MSCIFYVGLQIGILYMAVFKTGVVKILGYKVYRAKAPRRFWAAVSNGIVWSLVALVVAYRTF